VSPSTGPSLRRLGLTLEAAAALAMVGTLRGKIDFWDRMHLDPNLVLSGIFAIGVVLWAAGTLRMQKDRRRENP
jgi:hypothetical protein